MLAQQCKTCSLQRSTRCLTVAGSSGSSSASRGAAPSPTSGASSPAMRNGRTVPVENR